jgi:CRP-like cAMP-binding protein
MLSSEHSSHAVIKIVDFGSAQIAKDDDLLPGETPETGGMPTNSIANTPAYCPPEVLDQELRKKRGPANYNKIEASHDMWALGVILYIMLTGVHPFDLDGDATDEQVIQRIISRDAPPIRDSPLTAHLSESAISLIAQLMQWEPEHRLTAHKMLEHPWVQGQTARKGKMADSDKRLSMHKAYKSKLEAKVFADMVDFSDTLDINNDPSRNQESLLERAFHNLDGSKSGYITTRDLRRLSGHKITEPNKSLSFFGRPKAQTDEDRDSALSLSGFSELLAENMKNRYFPKGHVVYREGDTGNSMYFINSGTIHVTTSDGYTGSRTQGDTFGEGALLNMNRKNTSTIKCATPVHAIEINRPLFEKFLQSDDKQAKINLSEKDKSRKRERAKRLLLQPHLEQRTLKNGEYVYHVGESGDALPLFILEEGKAEVEVANGYVVFSLEPGEMCGDHVVVFNRPRNTSAICVSPEGCKFRVMSKKEYQKVLDKNPWWVKDSLRDISLRREFMKAIVMKTNKAFPAANEAEMRKIFNLADVNKSGRLELDNVREMLHSFDKSYTDADVKEILDALDLDETGAISFDEFKRMFWARKPSCNATKTA